MHQSDYWYESNIHRCIQIFSFFFSGEKDMSEISPPSKNLHSSQVRMHCLKVIRPGTFQWQIIYLFFIFLLLSAIWVIIIICPNSQRKKQFGTWRHSAASSPQAEHFYAGN